MPTIRIACVARKIKKIGIRTVTDSFTLCMLSTIKAPIAAVSIQSLNGLSDMWSRPNRGIAGGGNRDGDGQHIIDHERRAGK